jgi:signal transduction histidine kinase
MARITRQARPARSKSLAKRSPTSSHDSVAERAPSAPDDLLSALLEHLTPHTDMRPADPPQAAAAISACAVEIHAFAKRTNSHDVRKKLDLFADLLFDATNAIGKNERRWSRLAFDLHDGAQQEISALRMDLSTLSIRLQKSLRDEEQLNQALASARELDERLRSLDAGLRELVESFDSPALADLPFEDVVRELVATSSASTGIAVPLNLKGDFGLLTRSQHIAVLRVLAEALANIRQHSGATRIRVSVRLRARRVYLVVRDNGRGFAVGRTLARAANAHRLGLIGMTERARLLGGKLDIQSTPGGGPTTISLTLPAGDVGDSRKVAGTDGQQEKRRRAEES